MLGIVLAGHAADAVNEPVRTLVQKEKAAVLDTLKELVAFESGSKEFDELERIGTLIAARLEKLGGRVERVEPSEIYRMADTPEKMTRVPVEEIQRIIRPCGLSPQKARAISELSRMLVEKYSGKVPQTFEELEELPGVGHKTASVVMSQAFGVPAFPVDTHIHRLAARWGLSDGSNVERTERDLKKVFPKETWNDRHLQIIFFGREYCPALRHDFTACPICSFAASKAMKSGKPRQRAAQKTPRSAHPAAPERVAVIGDPR